MEGMSNELVKRHCQGKQLLVKHDPEFEGMRCLVVECLRDGVKVKVADKIIQFNYSDVEIDSFPSSKDIEEIFNWWNQKKEVVKKAVKDYGKEPGDTRDQIFRYIKTYFTKRDLKKLESIFENASFKRLSGQETFDDVMKFVESEGCNRGL